MSTWWGVSVPNPSTVQGSTVYTECERDWGKVGGQMGIYGCLQGL